MTVAAGDATAAQDTRVEPVATSAPWLGRALALTIDVLPGVVVVMAMQLARLAVPPEGWWWWLANVITGMVVLGTGANRVLLPAITGYSLGRAATGITVQRPAGAPAGPWRLLLRDVAHLLDTGSVFIGWLWPLWDQRGRTFADMLLGTEARRASGERVPGRASALVGAVFLAAALLCAGAAAVSYLAVYQHDRGIDTARTEVAAHGPKMVEQMLSYDPASLPDDFARAQSLATDHYREQLVEQQQVVQKTKPVPNQYWVVNSSVVSDPAPTPERATMMLFLQGQRGHKDHERFISATVLVDFVKSGGQWRVDALTPITSPRPAEGQR